MHTVMGVLLRTTVDVEDVSPTVTAPLEPTEV